MQQYLLLSEYSRQRDCSVDLEANISFFCYSANISEQIEVKILKRI
jgi:hypothetical protein